jgi:translation initiation factor IF-2
MQQRRVRLGDILDDYCPRERRITNHVVVAMIEDAVKQTRCTTCDADHEYKEAKVPAARRRKAGALTSEDLDAGARPRPAMVDTEDPVPDEEPFDEPETLDEPQPFEASPGPVADADAANGDADADAQVAADGDRDEWPVHRPLIRATLPRPEGQAPERKATDFTVRPAGAGGRFDAQRNNGQRNRGHRPMRQGQGQGQPSGQAPRFGGSRPGPGQGSRPGGQGPRHGAGQGGPRHGSGPNGPQGQRHGGNRPAGGGSGRPGQGPGRGPRPGGAGRKRGR